MLDKRGSDGKANSLLFSLNDRLVLIPNLSVTIDSRPDQKKTLAKHAQSESLYDIIEETKHSIEDTKQQIASDLNVAGGAASDAPAKTSESDDTPARESLTQKTNDTSGQ